MKNGLKEFNNDFMKDFDLMVSEIKLPEEVKYDYSPIKTLLIKLRLIYLAKHLNYTFSISKDNYDELKEKSGLFDTAIKPIHKNQNLFQDSKCDIIWFNLQSSRITFFEVANFNSEKDVLFSFKERSINLNVRYVIVSPDIDRNYIMNEVNKPQFLGLDIRFFSYSAVEELYSICKRRKLKGVTEEFLDCFMEPVLGN